MTYDMQAAGDNGTHRTTQVGAVDWTHELTEHGPVVFKADVSQKFDFRPRTGIQCIGAFAPGLTAQGRAGIVGLVTNTDPQTVLHQTLGDYSRGSWPMPVWRHRCGGQRRCRSATRRTGSAGN
jgi:hypothetical protein